MSGQLYPKENTGLPRTLAADTTYILAANSALIETKRGLRDAEVPPVAYRLVRPHWRPHRELISFTYYGPRRDIDV